jgi:hypothetical protein
LSGFEKAEVGGQWSVISEAVIGGRRFMAGERKEGIWINPKDIAINSRWRGKMISLDTMLKEHQHWA